MAGTLGVLGSKEGICLLSSGLGQREEYEEAGSRTKEAEGLWELATRLSEVTLEGGSLSSLASGGKSQETEGCKNCFLYQESQL